MNKDSDEFPGIFERPLDEIAAAVDASTGELRMHEVGIIKSITTGIARVSGLPSAGFDELLEFTGGVSGIVFNLDRDEIGVVLLGDFAQLQAGDEVDRKSVV